jgi:hypothetical protein
MRIEIKGYDDQKFKKKLQLKILIFFDQILQFTAVLWIRIRSDPELFAGSGSGINHFGSGQSGSGMNFIPNFSVKK